MSTLDEAIVSDASLLELALAEGADPNSKGSWGQTPLHIAAKIGSAQAIDLLLYHGALPDALDEYGDSPLLSAVGHNHVEVARTLLSAGARLSYSHTPDPASPAQVGLFNIMETAIHSRKDAPPPEWLKNLPEDLAADLTSEKHLESMIAHSRKIHLSETEKHAVSECNSLEMLAMLVDEFHADLDQVDGCGYWPLKSFAEASDLRAVQWLLGHGAKVDQTSTGETTLFSAIGNDNLEMVSLLIDAGANVNQQDVDMCVPLNCCRSVAMAALLLESGADPRIPDQCGFPPWHFVDDPETRRSIQIAAESFSTPT
ncbi:MAG: ankyrin repeat domain-containing protein [Luteolibacter sp.]|uniref:ankyrin repeat domain-containing protein n=1 Tax=Luteolibacter sp. TaxID=1962973 RepID=UPI003264AD72